MWFGRTSMARGGETRFAAIRCAQRRAGSRPQRRLLGLPRGVTPEEWAIAGNPIAGTCPLCGAPCVQFTGFTSNLRESGSCTRCGASNRQRQMAFVLRKALRLGASHRLALPPGCRLYSAEATGPLHTTLAESAGYICSEYWAQAMRRARTWTEFNTRTWSDFLSLTIRWTSS